MKSGRIRIELEAALDAASEPLAAILKSEELSGRDHFALHPCDLGNALHPADAVLHAFDMNDQIDCAGDLHADRPERQAQIGHHHHVLDPVERVAWRVGVHRRHRPVMPGVHRLQHVEGLCATDLADDDAVGAHTQRVAHELALRDLTNSFDVRRACFHLHHVRLLQTQLNGVFDGDHSLVAVDVLRHRV